MTDEDYDDMLGFANEPTQQRYDPVFDEPISPVRTRTRRHLSIWSKLLIAGIILIMGMAAAVGLFAQTFR